MAHSVNRDVFLKKEISFDTSPPPKKKKKSPFFYVCVVRKEYHNNFHNTILKQLYNMLNLIYFNYFTFLLLSCRYLNVSPFSIEFSEQEYTE